MGGIALFVALYGPLLTAAPGVWRKAGGWVVAGTAIAMLVIITLRVAVPQASYLLALKLPTRADYYEYPEAIDQLPAGTVVANLAGRSWNFPLYGAHLRNKVLSYEEAIMLFREDQSLSLCSCEVQWVLPGSTLRQRDITHVFVSGVFDLSTNGCLAIELVDELRLNRYNRVPLPQPRILYRIVGDCPEDNAVFTPVEAPRAKP
jgi:hypothetical protein